MADLKDKVITVESLGALHEHNKATYETKENVNTIENSLNERIGEVEDDLANFFTSGATVLSSYQYGDELPEAGTVGRIFFKRLTDI